MQCLRSAMLSFNCFLMKYNILMFQGSQLKKMMNTSVPPLPINTKCTQKLNQ